MPSYQDVDRIKSRISYSEDEFYDIDPEVNFDELLEKLEVESRGLIESFKGDLTFATETRTDEFIAPDTQRINLAYPVRDINQVEVKRRFSSDWEVLDESKYDFTEHVLILEEYPGVYTRDRRAEGFYSHYKREQMRLSWRDFYQKVKVTYERGWDEIPGDVLNIQIDIINRMLRLMRMEQSVTAIDPGDPALDSPHDDILTDDIRKRLANISMFGRNTMII